MLRTILASVILLIVLPLTALANSDKVTICHAAGREGTTKYITLTISEKALKGHFHNNGTPKAGHEDDYMGPCESPSTSGSASPSTSPSASPSMKPTPSSKPSVSPVPSSRPRLPDTSMGR